jgi:hypothetical protein
MQQLLDVVVVVPHHNLAQVLELVVMEQTD